MEQLRYFYHPDHIGSSSWITDGTGQAIQHLHYLPLKSFAFFPPWRSVKEINSLYTHCLRRFGEDWVDQRNSSWNAPYTFSGKEKDAETGYGYFGARYYDSGLSLWLSVDPMSDKYPSMSPYNYCANNPVILMDPDGRDIYKFNENGDYLGKTKAEYDQIVISDGKKNITTSEKYKINTIAMITSENSKETVFEVTDPYKASDIFQFIGKKGNTKVEWEVALFENGKSYIGTSKSTYSVGALNPKINEENANGNKLLQLTHNHPSGVLKASGLMRGPKNEPSGTWGDVGCRKQIEKNNPNARTFIYDGNFFSPGYIEYNSKGEFGNKINKTPF